jgi:hypothetical protein
MIGVFLKGQCIVAISPHPYSLFFKNSISFDSPQQYMILMALGVYHGTSM